MRISRLLIYSALLSLAACGESTPPAGTGSSDTTPESGVLAHRADALTYVYHCDGGYTFTAHVTAADSWLFLPGATVQLPKVTSASGVKYSDGRSTFWSKGDEALLDHAGNSYRHCRNDRRAAIWEHAKLNGADFRAVGNEPGWHLEISNKRDIMLVSDYGQSRYEFVDATIITSSAERSTVYRADNGSNTIAVTLVGETCQDTMADEQYETRVTVNLDDRVLHGCGKPLH